MNRHSSPFLLPAALAAVVVLGACGSDPDRLSTPPSDRLRAPTPVEITAGAGPNRTAGGAPEVGSEMMVPWTVDYVLGEGLSVPSDDTGYVFDAATPVTADQVAALAAALGVTGEPVRIDEGYGVSWRVGPEDGTAPSLFVSDDAQQSWSYSNAWAEGIEGRPVCAVTVDPDGTQVAEDCPEPEPPPGVPTAADAEVRVRELLSAIGIEPTAVEFETFADGWSANVTASSTIDPRAAVLTWSFTFGPEGVLQYAGGALATPVAVGPYPLIDLATAFSRLQDQTYPGIFRGGLDTPVLATPEPAIEPTTPEPGVDPGGDPGVPVSAPVDGAEPEVLETITVTLVDVQADLWWAWDVDGAVWLLPAYRFIGDDGGWYTVPAVTDEFLIQADPGVPVPLPAEPAPSPVEPLPGETEPPVAPEATVVGGTPAIEGVAGITDIMRDVQYYPACSNEPVDIDGTTWFPVTDWGDSTTALYERITSVPREEPVDPTEGVRARVAPPGPGDDVGTLFVYADGYAWYLSDSGNGIWLTTDAQTYNWVC